MDTNWTKCLQVFPGLFNIDLDFNNVYKHAVYKKLFAALFGSKISMKIPPDRRTKSLRTKNYKMAANFTISKKTADRQQWSLSCSHGD